MRWITFKRLLELSPKSFWGLNIKLFAFLTIDSGELLCRIVVVLGFLFGAHFINYYIWIVNIETLMLILFVEVIYLMMKFKLNNIAW